MGSCQLLVISYQFLEKAAALKAKALKVLLCGVLLLLAACVPDYASPTPSIEQETPQGARLSSDFPGVIYGVEQMQDGYVLNDSRICLALNGDAFWERGEIWDSPDDLPRLSITLNQQPVAQLQLTMLTPIIQISDGRGGTVGSTPSGYNYCFITGDLAAGRYVVDLVATPVSGLIAQYRWDLIVP
jgi:hypothetical protein